MCNLVKKCSCCDQMFSDIDVFVMNIRHENALSCSLLDLSKSLGLRGEVSMLVRDAQIVAIRYEYADTPEIDRAEAIIKAIDDECSAFFKRVIDESELEMIPLAA